MTQRITRLCTLLAFVLIAALPAIAQQGRDTIRPASKPVENKRKQMMEELGLTKKQAQDLKAVNAEFAPKMKALRADSTLGKKERRQQVMQLMQQREEKLKGILTPDQMTKFRELQKAQMQNRRNGMDPEADNP